MVSSLQRLLNMCHDLKATEDRYVQSKGPAVHNNAWHKLHHFGLHGPLDLRGKLSPWENVAGQSHGEDCLLGRRVVVGHQLSQRLRLLLLLVCSVCCWSASAAESTNLLPVQIGSAQRTAWLYPFAQ